LRRPHRSLTVHNIADSALRFQGPEADPPAAPFGDLDRSPILVRTKSGNVLTAHGLLRESVIMDRREQILKHVTKDKKGLEIGPWFAPLAPKREGYNCLSLDVFDTETLRQKAEGDPAIPKSSLPLIEEVDILGTATDIEDAIEARDAAGTFDYIISSHNFEHLPNPVKFLRGCQKALKPGGYLSMAVPDKRACFDYFRPISTLGALLEAYLAERDRPTLIQLFDYLTYHSRYQSDEHELGSFPIALDPRKIVPIRTLKAAYDSLLKAFEGNDDSYRDTHCWVFTPTSFHVTMLDLAFIGLSHFFVEEISESNGNEFYVHLRNLGTATLEESDFFDTRHKLLHATMDECAYNSGYAYVLREQSAARTEALRNAEKSLSDLRGSKTWKLAAPLWRLETHGRRKTERRKRSTN
jgi:SAM-dependent methyltransferase